MDAGSQVCFLLPGIVASALLARFVVIPRVRVARHRFVMVAWGLVVFWGVFLLLLGASVESNILFDFPACDAPMCNGYYDQPDHVDQYMKELTLRYLLPPPWNETCFSDDPAICEWADKAVQERDPKAYSANFLTAILTAAASMGTMWFYTRRVEKPKIGPESSGPV